MAGYPPNQTGSPYAAVVPGGYPPPQQTQFPFPQPSSETPTYPPPQQTQFPFPQPSSSETPTYPPPQKTHFPFPQHSSCDTPPPQPQHTHFPFPQPFSCDTPPHPPPIRTQIPTPPQRENSIPNSSVYPPPSPSPFTAVVPSPAVFPPGTDPNAVACFQVADQNGEGLIDDAELQKGLSLYHHTFNIRTVRLLIFIYTDFSTAMKIGPTEFVTLYNSLKSWKGIFEKFDSNHSGKIHVKELAGALGSLGFAVPAPVLEFLTVKFGCGSENDKGIEYDNFIECCLVVKGLSDKFKEKDTTLSGSVTLTIESYLLTILPFITSEKPPSPPSTTPPQPNYPPPPQKQSSYPPSYPPQPSHSPFEKVVPSPVKFPPGTDSNAVACFQSADLNGEGFIDDVELQKGLSLYHHTFNIRTVRLLIFVYTNFSTVPKIGPTEFVTLYNSLKSWKAIFEKFDSDRSGRIHVTELAGALGNLGFAVPEPVLQFLILKFGCGSENDKGIEYDNFIECCLVVKGLSDKFKEKDTALNGSVTLTIESYLLTILPFITSDKPSSPPSTTPPQPNYPPPPQKQYPYPPSYPPQPSHSPFEKVVPSPVKFPPGTDSNAVACFQSADLNGEGLIDDVELQKGLSLYHHTFNIRTVRLLIFVYTNFSTVTKIGPTEFVTLYNSLKSWKAIFEKFDSDRSGKIHVTELAGALGNLGFAVPETVLQFLIVKFGCSSENDKGIEYDNFIECCLVVKGLSDKFKEKDTTLSGYVTLTIEAYLLTILPFITSEKPPSPPPTIPPQPTPYPPSYPLPSSHSPFEKVVPSPAKFPPGTDSNAVACFQSADQNGEGLIDEVELQKGLSLYHHTFNIRTVRLLVFVYTDFSTVTKIGPTEFVTLYNSLKSWKAIFEKFDRNRSGKIHVTELAGALASLGFAVPAPVLEFLIVKFGCGNENDKGIEYDNFIECCLIVKGLSDKFKEKDTTLSGSVTLTIESFLLTVLPFLTSEKPPSPPPSKPQSQPTYPSPQQKQSPYPPSYPPPSTHTYPPPPAPYPSPFAAVVPSPVKFPPGTDSNAVACFHLADQNGEGLIDDVELQKGLSLYHHTFNIRTVRLLIFVYTDFSTVTKIGPTEFVTMYESLKSWKAIFEKFDSDHSGKIDLVELGSVLGSLGFAVPAPVLELLVAKYGCGCENDKGIEYDNFIECCLIVKGLSDKFKEKDTTFSGSITLTIESFLLTILPFITSEQPPPPPPSPCPPPTTPPQPSCPPSYPPPSRHTYPPSPAPYPSPFSAVVPSPIVFPPGTDSNAVACFHAADQNGEGLIDDVELQKALSLYHHTFNIRTVRLLIFVYTNFSTIMKIGPTEFVTLYESLKSWKAIFEKFDSDRSGKIDLVELGSVLGNLGFAVPTPVLELLVAKYGCGGENNKGIEYDNFIECCLIVKGLSEKFKEKDTTFSGSITLTIESFLLTILPFITSEQPPPPPPSPCPPPTTPPQLTYPHQPNPQSPYPPSYPPPSTHTYPPSPAPYPSPFAAVVPSTVVFPPGTDSNTIACFKVADQNGEGFIDAVELQKGLSLYHHTFNIRTVRLLIFVYTNFSTVTKIGPTEFITVYNSLKSWKAIFEKFDSDHSGKISIKELGGALGSLGFAVPSQVLELLVTKYGCGCENDKGIEYDNFIECCLIVKGLSDKFKEKDTTFNGSITLTIESFLLTILPFITSEEPTPPPPKTPAQPTYPPSSTHHYPPQPQRQNSSSNSSSYPPPAPYPSPFAAVVPSPVVFPPGTDPNAVACFHAADQNGEGFIDDVELQKALSLYHHTFNIRTVRLLIFIYTNFSTVMKIGPTEFVTLYNSLKSWKAIFEKFDSDHSGKIGDTELAGALGNLGFAVPDSVLDSLITKFGCENDKGIQYDNFIECCLIVKGLTDMFKEKDTGLTGLVTFVYEPFLLSVLPFVTV